MLLSLKDITARCGPLLRFGEWRASTLMSCVKCEVSAATHTMKALRKL